MARHNIEKFSFGYAILKLMVDTWHNYVYYRRVIVLGRDNVDPDSHNIFAPNHQNALMDALAVLCTNKGQPVFLARSDIYKKKFISKILYYIKILPVYRMRDGFETLKLNDEVFLKTVDVIKSRNGLVILPEGNHAGQRRLRQLKKGICRIAFSAEEINDFNLNIKLIPVGLEFSSYFRFRQVLTVVYGKPVEVSQFRDTYLENQPKALNDLREALSEGMKKLIVHIESEEDYEALDELRSIVNGRYSDRVRFPKIFRDRVLIDRVNKLSAENQELYKTICEKSLSVKQKALDLRIGYRYLEKKRHGFLSLTLGALLLLATLPLFLYGMAFNYIFIEVPKMPLKKIADQQFHSSVRYVVSLLLAIVMMPLYLILSLILLKPWWVSLLVFISIPVSGLIAWNWALLFRRIEGGFRIRRLISAGNKTYKELKEDHSALMKIIKSL
ncbi:MAG: 1-acyl-sn-glycerol-3-phosphate acyltransferase [Bacteroidales bacterium]|nr:1-acyl-sn-glycerol-3-phosphate acyltransferase [Bacteroidales bacterium]